MRLKHVKGASEKIQASDCVIHTPEKYRGHFDDVFKNRNPLYIEIGMGKGNFIIENAKKYPHINFIGIEKFDSVMVRAIEKAEIEHLPNLRLIRMDAENIDQIFDHEVDLIYLNFSDPWPKKRHVNRRLTSSVFLKKYEFLFKKNMVIEMKTDNRHLFEYSVMSFCERQFRIEEICLNLYEEDLKDNIATEYELKFVSKGFPIYKIRVTKQI